MKDTAGSSYLAGLCYWVLGPQARTPAAPPLTASFEVLHCSLMLFGRFACVKGPEVATFAGFGIFLSRIESILT